MTVDDPDSVRLSASDLELLRRLDAELGPDPFAVGPQRPSRNRLAAHGVLVTLGLALLVLGLQVSVLLSFGGCLLVVSGARGLMRHLQRAHRSAREQPQP